MSDDFLSPTQLAERLGVHVVTLCHWRRDATGPKFVRIGARRILYAASDVEQWLASRKFSHRAAEAVAQQQQKVA